MQELDSLEKIINSELTSKIIRSKIKHNQILITIDDSNLIEVLLFLKTKLTMWRNHVMFWLDTFLHRYHGNKTSVVF